MAADKSDDGNRKFWERAASAPAWYIVEAVEGKDFELAVSLAAAFASMRGDDFEVLHLVERFHVLRRAMVGGVMTRQRVMRKVSRFGPLVFIRARMTRSLHEALIHMPQTWDVIRCRGSERLVVVTDAMIDFYRQKIPLGAAMKETDIVAGDVVRIIEGPATGYQGVVDKVDNGRSLRIHLSGSGGPAPVIIEAGHVELVCRGGPGLAKRKAPRAIEKIA